MLKIFLYQGLVILLYALSWFSVALAKGRNDVADIAWGGGFVCAAYTAYIVQGVNEARSLLILALVVILWHLGFIEEWLIEIIPDLASYFRVNIDQTIEALSDSDQVTSIAKKA